MKYRLKIEFDKGVKWYLPQVKTLFGWQNIYFSDYENHSGNILTSFSVEIIHYVRDEALNVIEKHKYPTKTVKMVTYEYL